jgi:hypothetical protein
VQIAAYCASALAGGTMFYFWWRMAREDRERMWRLYGLYSGLMLCGSCFGVVTWATYMMYTVNSFEANKSIQMFYRAGSIADRVQFFSSWALAYSSLAASQVTYAVEFLCLSTAELMVLDRMATFAAPRGHSDQKRWLVGGRIVMALVFAGNVTGLIYNIASAVFYQEASQVALKASAAFFVNNTVVGEELEAEFRSTFERALSIASVQSFCEVAVLLLIVAAFLAAGVVCARRIRSALLAVRGSSAAAATGRSLQMQVCATTGFVFVAFLLRAVISTMLAVASQFQDSSKRCPGVNSTLCDSSCYNVYTQLCQWEDYTPEFFPVVVLISSPLALLVALWGMTSKSALKAMKWGQSEMSPTSRGLLGDHSLPTMGERSKVEEPRSYSEK